MNERVFWCLFFVNIFYFYLLIYCLNNARLDQKQNHKTQKRFRKVQFPRQERTLIHRLEYHPDPDHLHQLLLNRHHSMPLPLVNNKKRTHHRSPRIQRQFLQVRTLRRGSCDPGRSHRNVFK
jgi:hypothetical protein